MSVDESVTNVEQTGDPSSEMKWYVIHTYSGQEKRVQKSLREHIARYEMEQHFDDIVVPAEEVIEMRGGQKRTAERNFYPGYVFVHMHMSPETWHLVSGIPYVSNFIGGRNPTPISESEAQAILDRIEDGVNKPKPKFYFAPGELVRVIEGPFEDFNGTVEDVNYEKSKLRVSVTIFGRSTPVELDFGQVDKS